MIIYRCENPITERGPYHGLSVNGGLLSNHNNTDKYPTPYEDMRDYNDKKLACGFKNLIQLTYWFSKPQRIQLRKNGWRFYAFEIADDEVKCGKRQCLFKRQLATKVKELTEDEISHWKSNWTNKAGVEAGSAEFVG